MLSLEQSAASGGEVNLDVAVYECNRAKVITGWLFYRNYPFIQIQSNAWDSVLISDTQMFHCHDSIEK